MIKEIIPHRGYKTLEFEPNYQQIIESKIKIIPTCGFHMKVDDIDEATYLILKGAVLVGIKARRVAENRRKKLGYTQHWSVFLEHVSPNAIKIWGDGKAAYPIKDFMSARRHLKQRIKSYLNQ